MPPDSSNSLVNLSGLTKPADTVIKKVSGAVGGWFAPYQIRRVARVPAAGMLPVVIGPMGGTEASGQREQGPMSEMSRRPKRAKL